MYITTRCNLKCKRCLLHIPYLKEQKDIPMEMIEETFDKLFCITDRIEKVILSGGETFLFVGLDRLLNWLFEKYESRIGIIELFSNGTVGRVRITDYKAGAKYLRNRGNEEGIGTLRSIRSHKRRKDKAARRVG